MKKVIKEVIEKLESASDDAHWILEMDDAKYSDLRDGLENALDTFAAVITKLKTLKERRDQ